MPGTDDKLAIDTYHGNCILTTAMTTHTMTTPNPYPLAQLIDEISELEREKLLVEQRLLRKQIAFDELIATIYARRPSTRNPILAR